MPRNANTGVYTPPANSWNPATPDTVISSADWNALRDDMATALNHAPSTTRALHPTTGQVQDGAFIWGGTAGGTADALTLTLTPAITAYTPGLTIRFRTGLTPNTTATPTLSVNGLAAHTITRYDGMPLIAGDLPANAVAEVIYDGNSWRLLLTVQSQTHGNDGATTVTSATSITLTNASTRIQAVSITTDQQSVFLPDAKTLMMGGPRFYIRNAGNKTFALRASNANQVVNGGFDNNAAWGLGTGWAINDGVATKTPGSATDIEQTLPTTDGIVYLVTYTITSTSGGSVRAVLKGGGPDVLGPFRNAPGTYIEELVSAGNTTLAVRADPSFSGSIDNVSLTLKYPNLLAGMPPGAVAECVLEDNSTVQGKWHVLSKNTMAAVPVVNTFLPSSLSETTFGVHTLKMTDDISLHFGYNSNRYPFVFAVDHSAIPAVIGTPVLISSVVANVTQAFSVTANKAFVLLNSTSGNCFIVSVSGTTCSVSSAASSPISTYGTHEGRPLTARLGANDDMFVVLGLGSDQNAAAQAIDVSGSTPVVGSVVNVSNFTTNGHPYLIGIFRVDNTRAVAFYIDDSGVSGAPYSIRANVLTLTGTNINVGPSAGISDVIHNNKERGTVCQISSTLYVWVYGSNNSVLAVAISVSGTSITFGSPVTITTLPSDLEVFFELGDKYQPIIFRLSDNRVFVAFRRYNDSTIISDYMCVILTVSGTSISAGPVFSLKYNVNPVFFNYNEHHTVVLLRHVISGDSAGRAIGLDHNSTSIVPSGSITPIGVPNFNLKIYAKLSNGLLCINYGTMGVSNLSPPMTAQLASSRMEVLAPCPNGNPVALGNFIIPEITWSDLKWPVEVAPRRLAFVGKAVLQEGTSHRLKLCIMEVVSWPH